MSFDLAGFREAAVTLDAERWLTYFAEDAVWTEYRHFDPPRRPHVMRGLAEIGPFLREVCADDLTIAFDNGLVDEHRAAYTLTVTLPGGRRIIENAILDHRDGRVTNLVEVEAWDP